MAVEEIKRFNNDVYEAQKLLKELQDAGSSVDKILDIAKTRGFSISKDDVEKAKETNVSDESPEGARALVGAVVGAAFVV